uniref:Acyl carrier protein n=1 Tax=Streptomyces olivaceus TaxID=47716 RepID=A8KQY0_STROV|nr:acyl carrier protein [Streptomyces olivaceus]
MLTLDALVAVIRRCAGDSDVTSLDGDILDTPYQDLGYDSLALLEIFASLERDYAVPISDEEVFETRTPRQTLDLINDRIKAAR